MLAGARLAIVNAPDDAVILRPPPPGEGVADVNAAVRDALRFPIAGPPLQELAKRGGTATIVLEPPALPLPSAQDDPRMDAIAGAVAELERAGVPVEKQTILVASGFARRPGQHEIAALVRPEFRRRFRGRVIVHDAESPELVQVGEWNDVPIRAHPALVQTDLVLVVTAAETVPRRRSCARAEPRRCAREARHRSYGRATPTAGGLRSSSSGFSPRGCPCLECRSSSTCRGWAAPSTASRTTRARSRRSRGRRCADPLRCCHGRPGGA
jgi:hypothetical protein